jgi:threonylcarbamoyladenosine tRNA methylthiotransferase MtaB
VQIRFETTGCRLNQIESESAARYFLDKDYSVDLRPLSAKSLVDEETYIVVVNTCAVTQKAEQKDRRIIRLLLEKCPNACVIVTGCYAQLAKQEILKLSSRIAVLEGQKKSRLSQIPDELKKKS